MRNDLWIIEARVDGRLDFAAPQPETIFGHAAITGLTDDAMAKMIFRLRPEASLNGGSIALWPAMIDSRFIARRKTW